MSNVSQNCKLRNSCIISGCECVEFFCGQKNFVSMSKNRFLRALWNFFQKGIIFFRSRDTSILYVTTELVHPVIISIAVVTLITVITVIPVSFNGHSTQLLVRTSNTKMCNIQCPSNVQQNVEYFTANHYSVDDANICTQIV